MTRPLPERIFLSAPCDQCGHPMDRAHGRRIIDAPPGETGIASIIEHGACQFGLCPCVLDTATGSALATPDIDVRAGLAAVRLAQAELRRAQAEMEDFIRRDVEPCWRGFMIEVALAGREQGWRPSHLYPIPSAEVVFAFEIDEYGIYFHATTDDEDHGQVEHSFYVPNDFIDPGTREEFKSGVLASQAPRTDSDTTDGTAGA